MIGEEGKKMDDEAKAPAALVKFTNDDEALEAIENMYIVSEALEDAKKRVEWVTEFIRDAGKAGKFMPTPPPAAATGQPQAQERPSAQPSYLDRPCYSPEAILARAIQNGADCDDDEAMDMARDAIREMKLQGYTVAPESAPKAPERPSVADPEDIRLLDHAFDVDDPDFDVQCEIEAWWRIRSMVDKRQAPESSPKKGGEACSPTGQPGGPDHG